MPAKFVWFDLGAEDTGAVRKFYAELLGWPISTAEGAGPYREWIMDGDQPWAGVVEADDATAGRWVPYVQVDDLDAATEQATALGATVVQEKSVGPAGTALTIADPGGALLSLWVPR
jgi:predicted enzyme related to lactoylglutathione lyase